MSATILLALSRLNEYFTCPRRYFWSYEYKYSGLRGTKSPIPLAVGGAVHKGLEAALRGASVETMVGEATTEFRDRLQKSPLVLEPTEDVLFTYTEQEKLIEALLRVFALRGLPALLEQYEILEIEQEYDLKLSDRVILRTRADGLLRSRTNQQPHILSWKTAKRFSRNHSDSGSHDVQGLSEAAAIEPIIGEEILGVQMVYLIKGDRSEYPKGSGHYQSSSSLLHPWHNPITGRYAHSWDWKDETGHGHTLGKGWHRVNIWDDMPLSDWIDRLHRGEIQPEAGDPFENVLVFPSPYLRRHEELEDWVAQTRELGEQLLQKREATEGKPEKEALNRHYPMNRRACDWPSPCPFQGICFGPGGSEPEETGLYQIRREWIYESEEA